jgi:hypothetical protein
MASPCPRCGATKTKSARHGLIYNTLWNLGYHLRCCSFCGRWRLFKRASRSAPHPDDMTYEQLQGDYDRRIAEAARWVPPQPAAPAPGIALGFAQASIGRGAPETTTSIGVAEAEDVADDYACCPDCGSTFYRRSRRRFFERLMRRPPMARCLRCGHRFPHPRHRHKRA